MELTCLPHQLLESWLPKAHRWRLPRGIASSREMGLPPGTHGQGLIYGYTRPSPFASRWDNALVLLTFKLFPMDSGWGEIQCSHIYLCLAFSSRLPLPSLQNLLGTFLHKAIKQESLFQAQLPGNLTSSCLLDNHTCKQNMNIFIT
jgi:hypothetical protein